MPTALDLSSCVLCGRALDDEAAVEAYGGMEVEVHADCAEAGLEGRDLDSPHADPDGEAGDGPGDAEEAAPESPAAGDEAPDEAEETVAAGADGAGAAGGAEEAGDDEGDPGWTRITDFD